MNQDDKPLTPAKPENATSATDSRKQRLAVALRDNLKRRKAQARAKMAPAAGARSAEKATD